MARGPLAAAGGIYDADMVVDALIERGGATSNAISAPRLDFGCSSGRLLRVLAAAYPGVRWLWLRPESARDRMGGGQSSAGSKFFVSGNAATAGP